MKLAKVFILFLFPIFLFGQEIPKVKLNDSTFLKLSKLDVETDIIGNIASTTFIMKFYNNTDRVLEGELAFPLGQGQSVTSFAMDVNSKMREAVIVEKEIGRVAFESTVRQTIDPGLLEITKGNNYNARVYPIPSNGYKTISITFEEELNAFDNKHIYSLPLNFTESLDFSLKINVYNQNQTPKVVEGKSYNLKFDKIDYKLIATTCKTDFIADKFLKIEFPIANQEVVDTYYDYFNIYKAFDNKSRLKEKPKSITILWDASFSMQYRRIDKEIKLLEDYINYLSEVEVNLITFSNDVSEQKSFKIQKGKWKNLKDVLVNTIYDGGTSFKSFPIISTDEALIFSDGMYNLGEIDSNYKGRIYTINSLNSANHQFLNQTAEFNNGKYINLKTVSLSNAIKELKTESFKFLGYTKNSKIVEVFPKANTTVYSDFSISGKFNENTSIQLLFGYNNEITERFTVSLTSSNYNSIVKRLWAKKKLAYLNKNKEDNKNEIINLSKKYHLITDFTSLIILDRLEDYVRYKIEPPSELKSEYKQRISEIENEEKNRLEEINNRKNELIEDYKELKTWYKTTFPIVKKVVENKKTETTLNNENQTEPTVEENNSNNQNQIPTNTLVNVDSSKNTISGVVSDENGLPLPSATINIKGQSTGVITDFEGNYAINANLGDVLEFSYVGYGTTEVVVGNLNTINSVLQLDNSLDEVIVIGYGVETERQSVSYSVQTIQSESVSSAIQSLNGEISGLQIQEHNGSLGSSPNIVIRGNSSIVSNNNPLYVIDGVVVSNNEFKNIPTDQISSLTVLKESSGSSLFGSRGANGVIVITTNEGLKNNKTEIDSLNYKIDNDFQFKPWKPDNDYLKFLEAQSTVEDAYKVYLNLRLDYKNTPSFFLDVSDFFDSKNRKDLAIKILSNLAEIDIDNHEVLRALAYKLEYYKAFNLALYVYKEVLKLRPEEPQSTRDLALAFESTGNYQKAFDLLYNIIEGNLIEKDLEDRFYGIEHIALIEAGHIYNKYKNQIVLTKEQKDNIFPVEVDLRVLVDWNHNDTDIDLWVDNPKDQLITYQNQRTDYGDRLSEDMTEGYGPEEYMIKEGLKGEYEVEIDYFSDEVQKILGPTILKITIFKNYGRKNETKEIRILRLKQGEENIEVGSINLF